MIRFGRPTRLRTSLLNSALIERSAETSLSTALCCSAPPIARYPLRRATTAGRRRAGTSSRLSSRTRSAPGRSATESEPRSHAPGTPSVRVWQFVDGADVFPHYYDRWPSTTGSECANAIACAVSTQMRLGGTLQKVQSNRQISIRHRRKDSRYQPSPGRLKQDGITVKF